MKLHPRSLFVSAVLICTASIASAHPGHSHSDIPSLIRHPFSGPEHLLGTLALGLAAGALVIVATRRVRMHAALRWTGALAVAAGITLGFA